MSEAVTVDQKAEELNLFHQWRATEQPRYFQALYTSMKPLIYQAAKKASYGSNIPESAHRIYAAQNFLDALRTYDPAKGSALQTHVFSAVHQKAKRLNYMFQNLGHIPENRASQVGNYQAEHANLSGELGREPTHHEIATRLGWSVRDVMHIQKEVHKDLAMSEGTEETPFSEGRGEEEVLDFLYHELTPEEQQVYDCVRGTHGRPKMVKTNGRVDFERIGATLGYSSSKARTIYGRIRAKYERMAKR